MTSKLVIGLLLLVFGNSMAFAEQAVFVDHNLVYVVESPVTENSKIDLYTIDKADREQQLLKKQAEIAPKYEALKKQLDQLDIDKDQEKYFQLADEQLKLQAEMFNGVVLNANFFKTIQSGETFQLTYIEDSTQEKLTENVKVSADMTDDASYEPAIIIPELKISYTRLDGPGGLIFNLVYYKGIPAPTVAEIQPGKMIRLK